jgi:hypothetical protein
MNLKLLAVVVLMLSGYAQAQYRSLILRPGETRNMFDEQSRDWYSVTCGGGNPYPPPRPDPRPPMPPPQPICDRSGIQDSIARVSQYIAAVTSPGQSCAIRVDYCSNQMLNNDPYNREKSALLNYFSQVRSRIIEADRSRACDAGFLVRAANDYNNALESGRNRRVIIDSQPRLMFEDGELDSLKARF